jgi:hypothetical protein
MPFIRGPEYYNAVHAAQQKWDLLARREQLEVELETIAQKKAEAEAALKEDPSDEGLITQLKNLDKQEADANEELYEIIDRMVELGIGATTELEGEDADPTEGDLRKRLKFLQGIRAAGKLTEADSEEMKEILKTLATIGKNCDPKEVKTRRMTSLRDGAIYAVHPAGTDFRTGMTRL